MDQNEVQRVSRIVTTRRRDDTMGVKGMTKKELEQKVADLERTIEDLSIAPRCFYCGGIATKLCDHIIGYASDDGLIHINPPSKRITCSRPLCDECASQQGTIFFSDGADTWDYCAEHAGKMDDTPLIAPRKELIAIKRRMQFHTTV